jgi:hypothetical protein
MTEKSIEMTLTPGSMENGTSMLQTSIYIYRPASNGTGLLAFNGVGHSEFLWFCRGLAQIKTAFEVSLLSKPTNH